MAEQPPRHSSEEPSRPELERVMTELREANERLVVAGVRLQELADENDRARVEAERMRAQAESASQAKDEFVAAVSHELRTPLNAMLGWIHLLRQGLLPAEMTCRGLEVVERNGTLLKQVIGDLLLISEIITGKLGLNVRPLELPAVIETGIDTFRPAARAKQITLDMDIDSVPTILGDPRRLQQVVWNLLSNAIKFTPTGGRIRVELRAHDHAAEIRITDSGVGIDPDFLARVFDRFRQEQASSTRAFGGLGLGLAIVRELVELHGGTVRAQSEGKGKGTTFSVTLPFLDGTQPDPGDRIRIAESLDGLRLLVVEDDPESRELLTTVLEQHGAEVLAAPNAAAALSLLDPALPDAIIADIGLPDQDGYAFLEHVRRVPGADPAHLPAVALTAFAREDDRDKALAAGYQVHIAKPFDVRGLVDEIVRLTAHDSRPADTGRANPEVPHSSLPRT